jgi:type IV secretory pathway VirB10-like protein
MRHIRCLVPTWLSLVLMVTLTAGMAMAQSSPPSGATDTTSPPAQSTTPSPSPSQEGDKPPAAQTSPTPAPNIQAPSTQTESRTEVRSERIVETERPSSVFGLDSNVVMILGAVLFVVVILAVVAMARRTDDSTSTTRTTRTTITHT